MSEQDQVPVEPPARILIVDDEPLNVDYLEQELACLGFVTETASNGLEALERVAADPPDLVLLDVMMPELDGISALRILKGDPETRLIPVVLMTALNAVEDRVRGIEAGADDFLSKPVDERELLARIRTALSQKRTVDEKVGELRSTSAYLERYGRQERDVAVLVVDWRLRDASLPDEAVFFVGRRDREAAEERILELGGTPTETDAGALVAVFEGPDMRARSTAAVEAAIAVLGGTSADAEAGASPPVSVNAAVSAGRATVGSSRLEQAGELRWVYGADGEPVERASNLARGATGSGVLVADDAAAVVSDRFKLESVGNGVYRVHSPLTEEGDPDIAGGLPERRIRTILVTDIVDSTRIVERVGDRAWSELLAAHDRSIREELVLFGGEEIDTTGDGFLSSFDGPARAVRCALAIQERLAPLGLAIRAGVHTGEVEQVDGAARGIALHVASRIAARASSAEVLVSATTRDLAAGSGLTFTDRGEHALKGVSEPRRLYAVAEEGPPEPSLSSEADRPEFPAGLTAREVDVLRLVAAGLSDAEAASRLFLSVRTVNAHLRSIYRKIGVRSRAAAARFAVENGLLEPS
jgi:DNA-binding NarL/FixJ family response regulator